MEIKVGSLNEMMPKLKPEKNEIFSANFTTRDGCVINSLKNIFRPKNFTCGAAAHRGQGPPHS
jgi:hypothetical protein